ncbi:hypothetical protein AJ80_04145 [Polytolypa hystricis UAMH7299]|uniref:Major facilitator superfamily (MFS) profile domain-containing protein n=1 Tax=Polytolypa hystricis (strain UAMH7299) TaxID=1447883 RepID=A0A2B7YCB4_POLH7|nr:hypothetical protein AJ80_04145 [Polytolypa hystricis UAMH7299]
MTGHESEKPRDSVSDDVHVSARKVDDLEKKATVDTVHHDEALKVLPNYTGDETWAEKEEKHLLRKFDRRLLPLLYLTCGLHVWYCCTGYISGLSLLINYGVGQIGGGHSSWCWMYIFACGVTVIWGIAFGPIRAKGFGEREHYIAVARMRENNSGVWNTHFKKAQVFELLTDIKFWLMFFTAFLSMIANGPISSFKPIIINSFSFSGVNSLMLMMPSGVFAGTIQLLSPYLAFKFPSPRIWGWEFAACSMRIGGGKVVSLTQGKV